MPFTKNPLFERAGRALKEQARREFRRSAVGQLVHTASQVRGAASGSQQRKKLERMLHQFSRKGVSDKMRRVLRSSDMGRLATELNKYAKGSGALGSIASELLSQMGPVGKLIGALGKTLGKGSSQLDRELETAASFLEAFGGGQYDVKRKKKTASYKPVGRQTPGQRTIGAMDKRIRKARDFLEGLGYEVEPPDHLREQVAPKGRPRDPEPDAGQGPPRERRRTLPFGIDPETRGGRDRKVVDLPMAGEGRNRRFPVDHPIVTRKLVKTPQSSNVWAFSYSIEKEWLYVWFRQGKANKQGVKPNRAGPLYKYSHVPPEKFLSMMDAPSAGIWLWDHVRIRGTVSGHRYDYALVGVMGGYVPRKATLMPKGEALVPRSVRTRTGHERISSKPFAYVNRGAPNRGEPNRG